MIGPPRLHPAPGRAIVRIVPRLGVGDSALQTASGVSVSLSGHYENQPMVGRLEEVGDPTCEREKVIADWAVKQASEGRLFVFSTFGAGSPYWDEHMLALLAAGYDFRWLQGMRLFDISQLAATIEGSGTYGEDVGSAERTFAYLSMVPAEDDPAS